MYKSLAKNDSSINRLETYADQELTNNSSGVKFLSGVSGSSIVSESANWNWTNVLFYNLNYGEWGEYVSYKTHPRQTRYLDSNCRIVAIPNNKIGLRIKPDTFYLEDTQDAITRTYNDDGFGNIYDIASGSSFVKGNIFYYHGIAIFTDTGSFEQSIGLNTNIRFKSTHYIYEHNYLCHIGAGEMNIPTNPSARYATDSDSTHSEEDVRNINVAYITTIGLYTDENELVAIGKLANPLYNDPNQEMNILIRFDL